MMCWWKEMWTKNMVVQLLHKWAV